MARRAEAAGDGERETVLGREGQRALESAALDLVPLLEELSPAVRRDDAFLREALVRVTRQVFRERAARRPLILPILVRV